MTEVSSSRSLFHFLLELNIKIADCSGSIDAAELGALMRALGQRPTDAQIRAMIDDADVDRTGSIEFHEFVAMMTRSVRPTDRDAELRTAFAMFDQDGSGTIDLDELREVMRTIGERFSTHHLVKRCNDGRVHRGAANRRSSGRDDA